MKLPVTEIYDELIELFQTQSLILLQAPPGAGKSTWLPLQLIRDQKFQKIIMLEPRRLAARNIANYLAQCQAEPLGRSIGLNIRHEKFSSSETQLEIVTEGVLTRMLQSDPELHGVDCIILDEFHERSISADTALAFALESQATLREDLKILLMSATLESEKIQARYQCPVVSSAGRSFPIETEYHPLQNEQLWLEAMPRLIQRAMREQAGSCLVFLPGQREIQFVAERLENLYKAETKLHIYRLFGEQDKALQQAAIAPCLNGERKIVLATNVAETSLTIAGIRIVVDSGKRRAPSFNLNTGVTALKTVNISLASATQRAGRAGRLEPGVVYRLGSKEHFLRREAYDLPDILCSDISDLMLEIKQWGTELSDLRLLDSPSAAQQQQALALLTALQAIDANRNITALGREILSLGTNLRWGHMLLQARALEHKLPGIEILSIYFVTLLESRLSKSRDLASALRTQFLKPEALFSRQLSRWLKRLRQPVAKSLHFEYLPILVALAYPDRIAKKRGQGFLMANGSGIALTQDHWHEQEYLAIAELGGHNGQQIFSAIAIQLEDIEAHLAHLIKPSEVVEFDATSKRFIAEQRRMLGAIIIDRKALNNSITAEQRSNVWIKLIRQTGLSLFNEFQDSPSGKHHSSAAQLLIRMTLAYTEIGDPFPAINEQYLLDHLEQWLSPFLDEIKSYDQLQKLSIVQPLLNCYDWHKQQQLDQLLPKTMTVPSGSSIALHYQLNGPAKLSVRIQEMYGLETTPSIANGKIKLLIDLLSPAQRSLQLTDDLQHFWQHSYRAVQKEMKGRYPKHFWPDDPATARATHKTKKYM
ncbi:MAG: ATP-dependent helicase HrpB [Pseudomonadales bacterium]|nr:ATP-dependent helicase HrpB [Pseudomonadales bacterium]